jgi:magnesium-transporting ATPase (P-type)
MMFESTHATIESVSMIEYAGAKLQIVKRFDFSHEVMVQSVIMAGKDGKAHVFVKGSSEAVPKLCKPATLPPSIRGGGAGECERRGVPDRHGGA